MKNPDENTNTPTYWFLVMEIARERFDFARAAEAQKQLAALGVEIKFREPKKGKVANA